MTKQNESYKKLLDIRFLDESQGVRLLSAKVLDLEARLAANGMCACCTVCCSGEGMFNAVLSGGKKGG